jgi:hypothetical protein
MDRMQLLTEPSWRAVAAQRLSRLLLAEDDAALETFRRTSPRDLPHHTLDELRSARRVLEGLARELSSHDPSGWASVVAAEAAFAPDYLSEEQTCERAPTALQEASPPSSQESSFVARLSSVRPLPATPLQQHTEPASHEMRQRAVTVDRILSWSVDDYARVCAELERAPHAADEIWAGRGIHGGPPVHEAIRVSWQSKMRDPLVRGQFVACLERHRMAKVERKQG